MKAKRADRRGPCEEIETRPGKAARGEARKSGNHGCAAQGTCFRLEPNKRLIPRFDSCCIAEFPVAKPGEMGLRVLDNCCEDHIM